MLRGPRAVPTLPRDRCPSSLTPGCREPGQFHRDPPGSFGTCTWYRYPTPNRKHKAEAGAWAGCQHPEEETGCLSPGHCLSPATACQPPGLETWPAKGMNGCRESGWIHRPAAGISCSSSASPSPGQHNTLRQRSSSQAPALALPPHPRAPMAQHSFLSHCKGFSP